MPSFSPHEPFIAIGIVSFISPSVIAGWLAHHTSGGCLHIRQCFQWAHHCASIRRPLFILAFDELIDCTERDEVMAPRLLPFRERSAPLATRPSGRGARTHSKQLASTLHLDGLVVAPFDQCAVHSCPASIHPTI